MREYPETKIELYGVSMQKEGEEEEEESAEMGELMIPRRYSIAAGALEGVTQSIPPANSMVLSTI